MAIEVTPEGIVADPVQDELVVTSFETIVKVPLVEQFTVEVSDEKTKSIP